MLDPAAGWLTGISHHRNSYLWAEVTGESCIGYYCQVVDDGEVWHKCTKILEVD